MKKLSKCLMLIALLAMASCSKGDAAKLNGTTWAAAYYEYALWIKFTSEKNFMEYMGDTFGNPYETGVQYGTYSVKGDKITFDTHDSTSPFDYAYLKNDGTVMDLTYKSGLTRTFVKK